MKKTFKFVNRQLTMGVCLRIVLLCLSLPYLTNSSNVTLISISTRNGGREGYWWMNPTYDVIVDLIRLANPKLFQNFTHVSLRYIDPLLTQDRIDDLPDGRDQPGLKDSAPPPPHECVVGNISDFFFQFYYQNVHLFTGHLQEQFTIVTVADCDENVVEAANFLPDTNVLYALSTPVSLLSNDRKFPTTLNLFSMMDTYFVQVVAVMAKKFSWSGVNLLCNSVGGFNFKMCDLFDSFLQDSIMRNLALDRIIVHVERADIGQANFTHVRESLLTRRVVMVLLEPELLRRFMVIADYWNITNGDYIFLAFGIPGIPSENAIFYKKNDTDDLRAFRAFRNMFIIKDSNQEGNSPVNEMVNTEFQQRYDLKINMENQVKKKDIETPVKQLELFSIFAQTYERLYDDLGGLTIRDFVKESCNRDYNLSTRWAFVDEFGVMRTLINIQRLGFRGEFETAMTCDLMVPEVTIVNLNWYGHDTLPGDIPRCGLQGEKCLTTREPELINVGIPIICVSAVILTVIAVRIVRGMVLRNRLEHLIITEDQLTMLPGSKHDTRVEVVGHEAIFQEQSAYVKEFVGGVNLRNLTKDNALVNGIITISLTNHPFLAEFHGVFVNRGICHLVYERPTKGSLDMILQSTDVFRDLEIRLVVMKSFLQGISFIHGSGLKYHGALTMDMLFLNHRYTPRITQAGFVHLSNAMKVNMIGSTDHKDLYRSPSGRTGQEAVTAFHQQDDLRKFGEILAEVLDIESYAAISNSELNTSHPCRLMTHYAAVWTANLKTVQGKPTNQNLVKWLSSMNTQGISMADLLLHRLQRHAEFLENTVLNRTMALVEEMRKVDDLLKEILPQAIIARLRNHEPIVAEEFDSVTILFSDIPAFGSIVADRRPMEVVMFLNQLHSSFDKVVARFHVYKVETINDSYVVASGVPIRNGTNHAVEICRLALDLLSAGHEAQVLSWDPMSVCPRIGINSGYIAAGVAGTRAPRYCLFGDTMNTASRMESHGMANKAHISGTTRSLVRDYRPADAVADLIFTSRGLVTLKGKGTVETFWLRRSTVKSISW